MQSAIAPPDLHPIEINRSCFCELLTIVNGNADGFSTRVSSCMVEYFYDHQTDQLSLTLDDFGRYQGSEEVMPGVIVHIDSKRRALAVEIRAARTTVGVKGLQSFELGNMTNDELSQRLQESANGREVLRVIRRAS